MVGVTGSIPVAPTILPSPANQAETGRARGPRLLAALLREAPPTSGGRRLEVFDASITRRAMAGRGIRSAVNRFGAFGNEHPDGAVLSRRDEQFALAGLADEEIGTGDL